MPRNFSISSLIRASIIPRFNEAAADAAEFCERNLCPFLNSNGFNEAAADAAEFFKFTRNEKLLLSELQ